MRQSTVPSKGNMPGESLRNKHTRLDSLGTFPLHRFLLSATRVTVFLRYWQLNVSLPGRTRLAADSRRRGINQCLQVLVCHLFEIDMKSWSEIVGRQDGQVREQYLTWRKSKALDTLTLNDHRIIDSSLCVFGKGTLQKNVCTRSSFTVFASSGHHHSGRLPTKEVNYVTWKGNFL